MRSLLLEDRRDRSFLVEFDWEDAIAKRFAAALRYRSILDT
jgi:hypothetical protein